MSATLESGSTNAPPGPADRRRAQWLALLAFVFIWTMTTHGKYSASGDEPHYLMIAHSLVVDRDIDVANNYAANDGRLIGHDHLDMGLHAVPARTGRVLPIHDVGLGVGLAPVYAVARQIAGRVPPSWLTRVRMDKGLFTYSLISMFLAAMTCIAMTFVTAGLGAVASPAAAAWLTFAAWISPPVSSHAFLVFPEVPALFVTSVVVWFTLSPPHPRDEARLVALAGLLGVLPWTHHKFLLYSAGLAFLILRGRADVVRKASFGRRALLAAVFIAPQLLLLAWSWYEWGTMGGALTTGALPFTFANLKEGLFGLWIDRQSGLLAYAPIYWILPACCWLSIHDRRVRDEGLPFALLYVPAAAFVIGWWAGFAPAARYLVPAVPLMLVPIAASTRHAPVRGAIAALAVAQLAIDVVVWQHPRWLWPTAAGNPMLDALGSAGRVYAFLLPPLQGRGLASSVAWVVASWAIASSVLVSISRRRMRAGVRRAASPE